MKTSTKNVIITGCFGIITAFIGVGIGHGIQANEVEATIEKSGIITINHNESSTNAIERLLDVYSNLHSDYNELSIENANLKQENIHLSKQIDDLENNTIQLSSNKIVNNTTQRISEEKNNALYLNELQVYNCKYYNSGTWTATDIPEWNIYNDKTADGNTHDNAVHMSVNGTILGSAQIYVVEYLLQYEYETFNGNFMLDEISKSTTSIATLKIYGDDIVLYECNNITGGIVPQNTGDISVADVNKISFEFTSQEGELGNYNSHFGVVFYDTILK